MRKISIATGMLLLSAANAIAGPIFSDSSYSDDISFTDVLGSTSMTLAYDGTNYWSTSGGSVGGVRYAQYDSSGNATSTYSPGIDFRSVFTDDSGNVYARGYASSTIYQQSSPGVFNSYSTLSGGILDSQSSVVMNEDGEFVAMINGVVSIWDATGNFSLSFSLDGYTGGYPQNRGIAVADNYLFTYFDQTLTAWDYSGNLLDQTTLLNAGTSFDSYFSLSYANDHIFVVDQNGQTWRGYDVGLSGVPAPTPVPEPGTLALLTLAAAGIGFTRKRKLR